MPKRNRRDFLGVTAATVAGMTVPATVHAALPTPSSAEGPFYPSQSMRFEDVDNDLVKIAGLVRDAGGEIFQLSGRVLDQQGMPIPGARVEIWQVDMNARYIHTGDRGGKPRDAAFQGFGHDITDEEGRYQFRTIKPVSYPGRPPHIHVKVFTEARELTTQFFVADSPFNARDSLFRRMSKEEQESVLMRFQGEPHEATAEVHVVL